MTQSRLKMLSRLLKEWSDEFLVKVDNTRPVDLVDISQPMYCEIVDQIRRQVERDIE